MFILCAFYNSNLAIKFEGGNRNFNEIVLHIYFLLAGQIIG